MNRLAIAVTKDLAAAFRDVVKAAARGVDALDRFVMDVHSPVRTGDRDRPLACSGHRGRIDWPCPDYNAAADRLESRTRS